MPPEQCRSPGDAYLERLFGAEEYRRTRPEIGAGSGGRAPASGGVVLPSNLTDEEQRTVRDFLDAMERGDISPDYAAEFHARLQRIVDSFGSAAAAVEAGHLRQLRDGRLWPRDAAGDSWEVHHVIELQYGGTDDWGNYLALPRLVHDQLTQIWAAFGRQHRAEVQAARSDAAQPAPVAR